MCLLSAMSPSTASTTLVLPRRLGFTVFLFLAWFVTFSFASIVNQSQCNLKLVSFTPNPSNTTLSSAVANVSVAICSPAALYKLKLSAVYHPHHYPHHYPTAVSDLLLHYDNENSLVDSDSNLPCIHAWATFSISQQPKQQILTGLSVNVSSALDMDNNIDNILCSSTLPIPASSSYLARQQQLFPKQSVNRPAVLSFLPPRRAYSTEGGDIITAILSSPPPMNSTAVLTLFHSLENISIQQEFRSSNNLTFRLPPVPTSFSSSLIPWLLDFVPLDLNTTDNNIRATDSTSSYKFRFSNPPFISSSIPSSLHTNSALPPILLLTGTFPTDSSLILTFNNATILPPHHILSLSSTHVAISLPRNLMTSPFITLSITSVLDEIPSNVFNIPVLSNSTSLSFIRASVALSSQISPSAPVLLPPSCEKQPAAVIVQATWEGTGCIADDDDDLFYTFSVWNESTGELIQFARNQAQIATLPSRFMSSSSKVAVVVVDASNLNASSVVVVDTQPRLYVLGVSVTQSVNVDGDIAFDVSFTSCNSQNDDDKNRTSVEYEWVVNGTTWSTNILRMGSRLIISKRDTPFTFSVHVRMYESNSENEEDNDDIVLIQNGSSHGYFPRIPDTSMKIIAVLNDGAVNLTTGISSQFEIYAGVLVENQAVDLDYELRYDWSCSWADSGKPCPTELLPIEFSTTNVTFTANTTSNSNVSAFNVIATDDIVKPGDVVLYAVSVSRIVGNETVGEHVTPRPLYIRFEDLEFNPLPPLIIHAFGTAEEEQRKGLGQFSFDFPCNQQRASVWRKDGLPMSNVDFSLVLSDTKGVGAEQNENVLLVALVDGNRSWTNANSSSSLLLSLDLSRINAGVYNLQAFDIANDVVARAWELNVRRCVKVSALAVPVRWGVAAQTIFYASVSVVGENRNGHGNMFVFSLVRNGTENQQFEKIQGEDSGSNKLENENGISENYVVNDSTIILAYVHTSQRNAAVASFKLRRGLNGIFRVRIHVYDVSGSILLTSTTSNATISLPQNSAATTSTEVVFSESRVRAAIAWKDYLELLYILQQHDVDIEDDVPSDFFDLAVGAITHLSERVTSIVVAASIIRACTTIAVLHPLRQIELISIIDRVIESSLPYTTSGYLLRHSLGSFYVNLPSKPIVRLSALANYGAVLSTGLSCGEMQHSVIRRDLEMATVGNDEYRISMECFTGQIGAMYPVPVLYSACNATDSELRPNVGQVRYILAFQQQQEFGNNTGEESDVEDVVKSAVVGVKYIQRDLIVTENSTLSFRIKPLLSSSPSQDDCHWTQLAVNISLPTSFSSRSSRQGEVEELLCYEAGNVTIVSDDDADGRPNDISFKEAVSDFTVRGSENIQILTWVQRLTMDGGLQLSVNRTTVNTCKKGATIVGRRTIGGVNVALAVALVVVAVFVAAVVLVLVGIWRRRGGGMRTIRWNQEELWGDEESEVGGHIDMEDGRMDFDGEMRTTPVTRVVFGSERDEERNRRWGIGKSIKEFGRSRARGRGRISDFYERNAEYVAWDTAYTGVRVGENGALSMDEPSHMIRVAQHRARVSTAEMNDENENENENEDQDENEDEDEDENENEDEDEDEDENENEDENEDENENGNGNRNGNERRIPPPVSVVTDEVNNENNTNMNNEDNESYSNSESMSSIGEYITMGGNDVISRDGGADVSNSEMDDGVSGSDSDNGPDASVFLRDEFGRGDVHSTSHRNTC